ncbi:MAG: type IV toxin-antitoxin system AbiEi family antitoxin domain-containing protein [Solirubrobacteraceae bacterium]
MRSKYATTARIAAGQHGRVARRQLIAAGVDRNTIQRWLKDGRLHRVHKGVYAVGNRARSLRAHYMAAVLAAGDGAVLSHAAAAHLLGILRGRPPAPEVTVPTTAHRRRPGIVIHRVAHLPVLDAVTWHGIRTTDAPRILLDLARRLPLPDLTRACHEAWIHHDTTPRDIDACIARNPTKKGAAKLRRAHGADVTLSHLEDGFLDLLKAHGLPLPRTNIDYKGDKVDCRWPDRDLTVELLSYRYHASRHAFESDVARRRRSNHRAYTYGDVVERGAETAADIRRQLASRRR